MTASADLAIRLRRAEFNRALGSRDLAAIGPLLSPDVILVTGSDSAIIAGRKAQLLAWKREFAAASPTRYTRTPESVTMSAVEPIAMERGRWQGVTGEDCLRGTYAAKWRLIGEQWVIVAEIFVTLA